MVVAPWWYRIGTESPGPRRGCWEQDCATGALRATDVYCHTHDRILAISAARPRPGRWVLFTLVALAACAAFLLSGLLRSPYPVLVVALGLGALAVCLPLRRYAATWPVVLGYWLCAGAAIALLQNADPTAHRVARLVLVSAVLAAAALRCYGTARRRDPSGTTAVVAFPAIFGGTLFLLYGLLTVRSGGWLPAPSATAQRVLLLLGAAAGLIALVTLIVAGFVDGLRVSVLPVRPLLSRPASPSRRRPGRGLVGQVGATLENVLLFTVHLLGTAGILALNAAWFVLVATARRIRQTVLRAARRAASVARATIPAALESLRVIVVPVALLTTAAWLATVFAGRTAEYLAGDVLTAAARAAGAAVLASLIIFVTWALLANAPESRERARPLPSYLHSLKVTVPYWLLAQAAGGWLVGLPAALGHGDVHVGWITYATTAVLVVTFAVHLMTRNRSAEGRTGPGSHRTA